VRVELHFGNIMLSAAIWSARNVRHQIGSVIRGKLGVLRNECIKTYTLDKKTQLYTDIIEILKTNFDDNYYLHATLAS